MPKTIFQQSNFTAGELTPRLIGHTDLARYYAGSALLKNWLVQPQGGITRRPGTRHVAEAQDSARQGRLMPFIYSQGDAYVLELGHEVMRFYTGGSAVKATYTVNHASARNSSPWVVHLNVGAHDVQVGQEIVVSGVSPSGYNGTHTVTVVEEGIVKYELGSDPGAYSSGGSVEVVHQIATPWGEDDLAALQWAQSADVVYFAHPDHAPRKLSRFGATDWRLDKLDADDGPYEGENFDDNKELTPDATFGPGQFTLFSGTEDASDDVAVGPEASGGGSRYVAVGPTSAIKYSDDGGESWSAASGVPGSLTLRGVAYGLGVYIAISDTDIIRSSDGASGWASVKGSLSQNLHDIAYGDGAFVAVGNDNGSQAYILYSTDGGDTWSEGTNPQDEDLDLVAYGAGRFIAMSEGVATGSYMAYSDDRGATWTEITISDPPDSGTSGLAYSPELDIWAALKIDGSGNRFILTSGDGGVTWEKASAPTLSDSGALGWGHGHFLGLCDVSDNLRILVSKDGVDWELKNPSLSSWSPEANTSGIAFGDTSIVIVDGGFNSNLAYAKDGVSVTSNTFVWPDDPVGSVVRIAHSGTWGWGRVHRKVSDDEVIVHTGRDFNGTSASSSWRLGAWSDGRGWPYAVTMYQQRLVFGGSDYFPATLWLSRAASFENFALSDSSGSVSDDDGINVTIASNQVQRVHWLVAGRGLLIGTEGGVRQLGASSGPLAAVTPTDSTIREVSVYPTERDVLPVQIGEDTLYVQRAGRKLRAARYNFDTDSLLAEDVSLLAEHLLRKGLTALTYTDQPWSVLWCLRSDGVLIGLTFNRNQQVMAWHQHILGGAFSGGDAVVESIASIPESTHDQLWLLVKRTVDGGTVRSLEYLERPHDDAVDDLEDAAYLDASAVYDGAATTTPSGFAHLNGETARVFADGYDVGDKAVNGGSVTLDDSASVVRAGFAYDSDEKAMPLSVSEGVSLLGVPKRIHHLMLVLNEAGWLKVGRDFDNLDDVVHRRVEDEPDAPVPLRTETARVAFDAGMDDDPRSCLRADGPLPCTVLARAVAYSYTEEL